MRRENKDRISDRRRGDESLPGDDRRQGSDRRLAERVLIDFEVDYSSDETFLFASARNISALGIFLQTREPADAGTRVNLRFRLPPTGERLEVEGIVRWTNPFRPGDINSINPGMGIEFVDITLAQREAIVDLVRCIAFLADEEDEPTALA